MSQVPDGGLPVSWHDNLIYGLHLRAEPVASDRQRLPPADRAPFMMDGNASA